MIKKIYQNKRKIAMAERNSVNMWDIIKKDPVFLEAVCMYLISEELVNEGEIAFFKRM